jgi:hypothetical protein
MTGGVVRSVRGRATRGQHCWLCADAGLSCMREQAGAALQCGRAGAGKRKTDRALGSAREKERGSWAELGLPGGFGSSVGFLFSGFSSFLFQTPLKSI